MRQVGHRSTNGNGLSDQGALARTAAVLRGTAALVPRGLFRFRSHDEADQWMDEMFRRTHARQNRTTSPDSAGLIRTEHPHLHEDAISVHSSTASSAIDRPVGSLPVRA